VVISEPERGGYHGAEVAAPVFRAIADKCFAMKAEMHPPINARAAPPLQPSRLPSLDAGSKEDMKEALQWLKLDWYGQTSDLQDWVVIRPQGVDSLEMLPRVVSDKTVPSVVGMGLKDALYLLENRGCRVRVEGVGKVRRQSLAPGTRASGQTCVLFLE
jgi:cell division protein FtsI (penicillin-binding protein 3)